mmetsp:Transcript_12935/g.33697  ORF Transcript_12935/g.33697 Transcript_12935/m.33697 type:complete len:149 (-) Transcript_12935:285-731(-)
MLEKKASSWSLYSAEDGDVVNQDREEAYEQERLQRCHLCGAYLSTTSELYMLDDAVYCCASHRARAAAVDKAVAAGWEPRSNSSSCARRITTSTGVGLAASHRSWFSLNELGGGSSSSIAASSRASSVGSTERQTATHRAYSTPTVLI